MGLNSQTKEYEKQNMRENVLVNFMNGSSRTNTELNMAFVF